MDYAKDIKIGLKMKMLIYPFIPSIDDLNQFIKKFKAEIQIKWFIL